ncbi:septation protein IspZ [Buchnera aphidicola (Mollitrichosiphum nigrofasciatum)]|uniref:septation protein IspZ n=1 Tax=Buchnera aphidicola TaxID=9 RepID=UPI0031B7F9AE
MKKFIDILPILCFFLFYKKYDIFIASNTLIITSGLTIAIKWLIYKEIKKFDIISFVYIVFFTTLTIILHDSQFIKLKPTFVYFSLAIFLFINHIWMKKLFIKKILKKKFILPDSIYRKINISWIFFLILCGFSNAYVALNSPDNIWVNFKIFILNLAILIFVILNLIYIKYTISKNDKLK